MSSDIDSNPSSKHQKNIATQYKVFKEYVSSLFSFVANLNWQKKMLKSDRKSEKPRANNDSFSTACLLPSKCVSAKQKEQVT